MVNASLNWASIVGIVLAICGAGLYFMRSFKPSLARDYDVFFAAIGLLCGGILFFQGWRLDPILQFGQFLLAGTTVFFAYESVRLRGVATDQARRSSYFDDPEVSSRPPAGGMRGRWDESLDRFDESQPINRRFSRPDDLDEERSDRDFYQQRRISRAAIPEEAVSRRPRSPRGSFDDDLDQSIQSRRMARFKNNNYDSNPSSSFGERRNSRQDIRRGTRPLASDSNSSRGTRRPLDNDLNLSRGTRPLASDPNSSRGTRRPLDNVPNSSRNFNIDSKNDDLSFNSTNRSSRRTAASKNSSLRSKVEDASFSSTTSSKTNPSVNPRRSTSQDSMRRSSSDGKYKRQPPRGSSPRGRDNSSRFDN